MLGLGHSYCATNSHTLGNNRCAVVAINEEQKLQLLIFTGISLRAEFETDIQLITGRLDICLAVSRNDKFVALSSNDRIDIYHLEEGIRLMNFHHQVHVYELRGGVPHHRAIPVGKRTNNDSVTEALKAPRGLTWTEAAEEQKRQSTIMLRRIHFSTDSKQLVTATQLGDNYVYIDVYDCTREPISTISENSRSFKLPPWTLNDGDLTSSTLR